MEDVIDTPALRVMRHIAREGPINQRTFTEVSRKAPRHSQALRETMEDLGYLAVEETNPKMRVPPLQISLTPEGRKIAEHSIAQEEVDERLKRKRSAK
jgi:hypothetical protein